MHILPHKEDPAAKPGAAKKEEPKHKTVFQYRMDELAKAGAAIHLAADVIEDEHQISKLKKAEKLAKEAHDEARPKGATPPAPKAKEDEKTKAK